MNTIVRTEWLKLRKYPAFWWILSLTILAYPGINLIFHAIYLEESAKKNAMGELIKMMGNPFTFPETWHTVAFASSLVVFIPAVVVIMFITNEYTYKTNRQNIIDGWSRNIFMTSKLVDVLIISLLITLLYVITTFILGFINTTESKGNMFKEAYYTGLFFLQTFSQLSIAFLVGFLVRKAFIALGIFVFYFLILENLIIGLIYNQWKVTLKHLPLEVSDRMIPVPKFMGRLDAPRYQRALDDIGPHVFYTVLLTAFIWFLCYRINSRRDL